MITEAVKTYLIFLKQMGIKAVPLRSKESSQQNLQKTGAVHREQDILQQKRIALQAIRNRIGDCQRCKLHRSRTHIVFGTGNPMAELVFIGEGPGEDEDRQGEPFVGKAGQLLNRMIQAMGFKREEVYIANIVKCRPPHNRNPEPDEIAACEPFLIEQIGVIQPRLICALGNFAAQTLLRTRVKISQLRGRFHDYQGIKVMPTYHPAYLLRNPQDKRLVWEDLQQVMAELNTHSERRPRLSRRG